MFCPHCGHENIDSARYCARCGKELVAKTST
ncbi:zinc-ribbon domain-containing protein, partial [bacterium]|nr:zinc-ribbon domain-containing protein [bacterium]